VFLPIRNSGIVSLILCQIYAKLKLIFEIKLLASNHSKKSYQKYDIQPKTVKYIIFKNPKFYPNSTFEEVLNEILAIFKSLEKVPLNITVRERAES
jgi:hypothetical protein